MLGPWASIFAVAVRAGHESYEVALRGEEKARQCHDFILGKLG
jgi:hypothetical protein